MRFMNDHDRVIFTSCSNIKKNWRKREKKEEIKRGKESRRERRGTAPAAAAVVPAAAVSHLVSLKMRRHRERRGLKR